MSSLLEQIAADAELAKPMMLADEDAERERKAKRADSQAECWGAALDGGFLDFMDGERPASLRDEVAAQRVLVTFVLGSPAFFPPVSGAVTLRPVDDAVALAEGEITWARAYRADHKTAMCDLSVGSDLILETTSYTIAGAVHSLLDLKYRP